MRALSTMLAAPAPAPAIPIKRHFFKLLIENVKVDGLPDVRDPTIAPSRLSGRTEPFAIILLRASDALFVIKSEAHPGLAIRSQLSRAAAHSA